MIRACRRFEVSHRLLGSFCVSTPRRSSHQQRPPPLTGIKILDLTRVLAGPFCTQQLGDLGADVIKIEKPDTGDDTRAWGPPFLRDPLDNSETSESAYFLSCNRNKRSVGVDISTPQGAQFIRQLAKKCDVLVENFKVGGLKKYGLDYDSLKEDCPQLIYCSITGFGQTGPWREVAGYDFMVQGLGGLMSVTGEMDNRPGGGPQKAGVAVTDIVTGLYATIAITSAIIERGRSGLGQHLDLALLDCHISMLANLNLSYKCTGVAPTRQGNAHSNIVPYQTFKTLDGASSFMHI